MWLWVVWACAGVPERPATTAAEAPSGFWDQALGLPLRATP